MDVNIQYADVIEAYQKRYKIKENITKLQRVLVLSTKEFGKLFIRSAAKWAKNIKAGDVIDVKGIYNDSGKKTNFINKAKLIRKH